MLMGLFGSLMSFSDEAFELKELDITEKQKRQWKIEVDKKLAEYEKRAVSYYLHQEMMNDFDEQRRGGVEAHQKKRKKENRAYDKSRQAFLENRKKQDPKKQEELYQKHLKKVERDKIKRELNRKLYAKKKKYVQKRLESAFQVPEHEKLDLK